MAYGQPYNQQPFTGVQVGVTGGNQYWGQQQQGVPSQQVQWVVFLFSLFGVFLDALASLDLKLSVSE